MKNKITKNLIVFGIIIFSFALTNSVFAEALTYAFSTDPISYNNNQRYVNNDNSNMNNNPIYYPYDSNSQPQIQTPTQPQYVYYQQPVVNPATTTTTTKPTTSIVNNYYYQTAPATAKTATTTAKTTPTSSTSTSTPASTASTSVPSNTTSKVDSNNLGASAYNPYDQTTGNDITALSLRGSGGFMPSSIWQWILVVILILVIIVISRILIRKPVVIEDSYIAHAH